MRSIDVGELIGTEHAEAELYYSNIIRQLS